MLTGKIVVFNRNYVQVLFVLIFCLTISTSACSALILNLVRGYFVSRKNQNGFSTWRWRFQHSPSEYVPFVPLLSNEQVQYFQNTVSHNMKSALIEKRIWKMAETNIFMIMVPKVISYCLGINCVLNCVIVGVVENV